MQSSRKCPARLHRKFEALSNPRTHNSITRSKYSSRKALTCLDDPPLNSLGSRQPTMWEPFVFSCESNESFPASLPLHVDARTSKDLGLSPNLGTFEIGWSARLTRCQLRIQKGVRRVEIPGGNICQYCDVASSNNQRRIQTVTTSPPNFYTLRLTPEGRDPRQALRLQWYCFWTCAIGT